MSQPLEEISTERLIEEVAGRTGGLEAMKELVEVAFINKHLSGIRESSDNEKPSEVKNECEAS